MIYHVIFECDDEYHRLAGPVFWVRTHRSFADRWSNVPSCYDGSGATMRYHKPRPTAVFTEPLP